MELKHVLSKPRIRITLTRSDNDSNYSAYLNARIVRLDKIESKIRKMKKQSKSNVGHNPRIKILKPSILQTTKNTRKNEATKAISFSKGRDKKLSNRKERKRRKHSKERNNNKNDLDLDTYESDYHILRNAGEQQARSTKTCNSNLNQNYQHIKSEIIRDGSSHWVGSKNFSLSQSNNKLTEIALFKILNKKSIFSKFFLNILPIKKINPKNQPTFPSKYNKRKKNKKRRPRLKNSMERFIQKYILNKNPCERDETQINKYEPLVPTNSQTKCYKTRCVTTSPSQPHLNLNSMVCDPLSKRKSESYALNNNKTCDTGKTESEELFSPLSCLINEAKNINRNSFDLIQSTLEKSNSADFTNYEKLIQKFEKTSLLKRYHLISLSDLDLTSYQNHNFDGSCSKCDQILNDLLSSNQKLSDENNTQENISNHTNKVSNKYYLSDCLPSIEESKDDKDCKKSKDKQQINDDLNIRSTGSNRYKTLNAQVGIPIVQQITTCGCFQNSNRNSSTSVSDEYDHKGQKLSSSLEVNNSSNNSIIYTASIFDYETYQKSNRYMMVHCNDCDLICIVQPIENY